MSNHAEIPASDPTTTTTTPGKRITIKLVKSRSGSQARARRTLNALGIGKLNSSVIQPDNPSIRGMLYLVDHLVTVTPVEE